MQRLIITTHSSPIVWAVVWYYRAMVIAHQPTRIDGGSSSFEALLADCKTLPHIGPLRKHSEGQLDQ